jgi:hypothetical protein
MKNFRKPCIFLCATVLAGCAGAKVKYVKPDFSAPDFVAMLPADNQSNDMKAPRAMIGSVASGLIGLGYFPIASPVQEEALKGMGLTDGGQINAFKLSDIAANLGTDGLVKTQINSFKKINIGFYISPNVEGTVTLYDAGGASLWEVNSKWTKKQINLNPTDALTAGLSDLAGDLISKMFNTHLVMESQIMAGLMVQKAKQSRPPLAYPGPAYKGK